MVGGGGGGIAGLIMCLFNHMDLSFDVGCNYGCDPISSWQLHNSIPFSRR